VFPLPVVEGRVADAELAAELGDRGTVPGLPERLGDLLVGVSGLLRRRPSRTERTAL
jgi:hypothetical protein